MPCRKSGVLRNGFEGSRQTSTKFYTSDKHFIPAIRIFSIPTVLNQLFSLSNTQVKIQDSSKVSTKAKNWQTTALT